MKGGVGVKGALRDCSIVEYPVHVVDERRTLSLGDAMAEEVRRLFEAAPGWTAEVRGVRAVTLAQHVFQAMPRPFLFHVSPLGYFFHHLDTFALKNRSKGNRQKRKKKKEKRKKSSSFARKSKVKMR